MRTHTRVTTPRVPSLPTTTPRRSYPAASGPSAPNALERAVGHHDVEREHVRARDAVGEAVRAARVRAHVAADRRGLLARGVGREGEPERAQVVREVEVRHAGLDPREPVVGPHLDDARSCARSPRRGNRRSASRRPRARCRCRGARSAGRARRRCARTPAPARSSWAVPRARSRPRPSTRRGRRGDGRADRRAPPGAERGFQLAARGIDVGHDRRLPFGRGCMGGARGAGPGARRVRPRAVRGQGRVPRHAPARRGAPPAPGLTVVRRRPAARRRSGRAARRTTRSRSTGATRCTRRSTPTTTRARAVSSSCADGWSGSRRTIRARSRVPYEAPYELAIYACSVEEAVGTTYDGDRRSTGAGEVATRGAVRRRGRATRRRR